MKSRTPLWTLPMLLLAILALNGCGMGGGQFLFMMGVGRGARVPAKFNLTQEPLLVFVDDPRQRIDFPGADAIIMDEIAQELMHRKAALHIIPPATVDGLRRTHSDFDRLSVRQVGELAQADQVLWIDIREALIPEHISEASNAAHLMVTVRVLNAREKEHRSKVRLWPESPDGHLINVGLSGARVMELKTQKSIIKDLAKELSIKVAKLFYEHRLGDFEKEE